MAYKHWKCVVFKPRKSVKQNRKIENGWHRRQQLHLNLNHFLATWPMQSATNRQNHHRLPARFTANISKWNWKLVGERVRHVCARDIAPNWVVHPCGQRFLVRTNCSFNLSILYGEYGMQHTTGIGSFAILFAEHLTRSHFRQWIRAFIDCRKSLLWLCI